MPTKRTPPEPNVARVCPVCDSGFAVNAYRVREGRGTYCSRRCWYVAQGRTKVRLPCEHCGGSIARPLSGVQASEHHFCSYACRDAARAHVPLACVQCGRRFAVYPFEARTGRKLCSIDCRTAYQRIGQAERFWAKVQKSDGCWLWQRARDPRGYGRGVWRGRTGFAHRHAYRIAFGDFDPRLHVLHDCDNPPCVRPSHLHLGTHPDNMHEASERRRFPHGEAHSGARLTIEAVRDIRARHAAGATQRALARDYTVSEGTIHSVVHRLTWRHVE